MDRSWIVLVGFCCVLLGGLVFICTLGSGVLKRIADTNPEILLWLAVTLFLGGWMIICLGYIIQTLSGKRD